MVFIYMGVVGGWAVIGWCLRTFPLRVRAESFFSGWYSYPRMPFGFGSAMWLMPSNWKRNVSAVQS